MRVPERRQAIVVEDPPAVGDLDLRGGHGLQLRADIREDVAEHGRVPHTTSSDITCTNWWANANSEVKRSLFLDNYVYSVSDAECTPTKPCPADRTPQVLDFRRADERREPPAEGTAGARLDQGPGPI